MILLQYAKFLMLKMVCHIFFEIIIVVIFVFVLHFRIGNQVMTKQWPKIKHLLRLWSMVCHQLVVGVWVLIG
jgi:hypothetical protein